MLEHREAITGMSVLVAVVDAGSLTAAAARLGMTSSAVSKQVSRLEARLGTRLLQRTTRRMQLTEAGARYCERARSILESIESVEREAESVPESPHGTLRVTAPTVLGQVQVMPVVLAFQQKHPAVKVHVELSDRRFDLIEEGIDVAIRITAHPPPAFVARRLADDRRVLCASPGYLARAGRPRRPAELANHECIVFVAGQPAETWNLRATEDAEHATPIRIAGRLHVNNTLALRQASLAGLGIADLPRYLVEEDLAAGRLESVLERFIPVGRGVFAIYAPSPYVPARVRGFIEMLEETFQPGRPHVRPRKR
ncbi:LysR family transcriptional regulator [Vitiosangium sp. GDMCC 1.1324]|uniref:LysR family transcriptional regulator n=1 Tax=Vitiosangium sp. (strain GDMCC 1.1324) TaxID=2138576 RepID=UPI000D37EE0E|nr:LysR family transcriptional regulator [Vitiosangium sp. GDMCC 1.1324]PTL77259.1 LysR family transcriptional regulator [Vitiosangium sp. GDMCC 1.1324]